MSDPKFEDTEKSLNFFRDYGASLDDCNIYQHEDETDEEFKKRIIDLVNKE
jgi:hypothetical protein